MRIFLLADLHNRVDWYRWLSQQKADLMVIAGDFLDGFHPGGLLPQMLSFREWCAQFRGSLALCSGNHDGNEADGGVDPDGLAGLPEEKRQAVLEMLSAKHWMDSLERPGLVTDARTALFETSGGPLVVTTIPFNHWLRGNTFADDLWRTGAMLRKSCCTHWLVLHHEPPAGTSVGGPSGDPELFYKIRVYRPNFVVSGHQHSQPYIGSFADQIDGTWCFNPGFPVVNRAIRAKIPNHILLDLANRTATWHATATVGRIPIIKQIKLE